MTNYEEESVKSTNYLSQNFDSATTRLKHH